MVPMMRTAPDFEFTASGLARPECVLTSASGRLYVSDSRGGVQVIEADGRQTRIGSEPGLIPNGIALMRDGSFLIANLGEAGGIWRITRDGKVAPHLTQVEGHTLPRVNYVYVDEQERLWFCISATDSGDIYPMDARTGSIILQDAKGCRIVADGLQYTNECRLDATGNYLYVNETFGRCLTRFAVAPDGTLSARETIARFTGAGDLPDGLAPDAEGGVWVACIGSNRLYRVARDGSVHTMIDDADPACANQIEAALAARTLTRPQLAAARGRRLPNITSIAFGGPDLKTGYMGSLAGEALACFRSPVAGLVPAHWHWG